MDTIRARVKQGGGAGELGARRATILGEVGVSLDVARFKTFVSDPDHVGMPRTQADGKHVSPETFQKLRKHPDVETEKGGGKPEEKIESEEPVVAAKRGPGRPPKTGGRA